MKLTKERLSALLKEFKFETNIFFGPQGMNIINKKIYIKVY